MKRAEGESGRDEKGKKGIRDWGVGTRTPPPRRRTFARANHRERVTLKSYGARPPPLVEELLESEVALSAAYDEGMIEVASCLLMQSCQLFPPDCIRASINFGHKQTGAAACFGVSSPRMLLFFPPFLSFSFFLSFFSPILLRRVIQQRQLTSPHPPPIDRSSKAPLPSFLLLPLLLFLPKIRHPFHTIPPPPPPPPPPTPTPIILKLLPLLLLLAVY